MLSTSLSAVLILVTGQLFPPIPVPESATIHLHVGKHGHWTLKIESTCHLRFADQVDTETAFQDIADGELEAFASSKGDYECQVKVTGEKQGTIVLTGRGDDVVELFELMRDVLGLERCAFSWDRRCLQIGGFPPKMEDHGVGAVVGAILLAIVIGDANPNIKVETVLTTDGRFVAEHLPGKIDDDGRRLVLDIAKPFESPEQERTLRIEGLEE